MKTDVFELEFIDSIPRELKPATLYISMKYATTIHLCASGCGNKVVLPLSPAEWKLYFDGESVSLSPSVGNWEYPCQAHYWIRKNRVEWAGRWSRERIEAGRRDDVRDLDNLFERSADTTSARTRRASIWERLRSLFR